MLPATRSDDARCDSGHIAFDLAYARSSNPFGGSGNRMHGESVTPSYVLVRLFDVHAISPITLPSDADRGFVEDERAGTICQDARTRQLRPEDSRGERRGNQGLYSRLSLDAGAFVETIVCMIAMLRYGEFHNAHSPLADALSADRPCRP